MTYQGNQQMQNGYNVLVMYFWRKDPITIYSQTEFYRHPLKKNRHLIITSVFFVPEESPCILCKVNLLNRETFYGPPQCPVFCVSHYHKVLYSTFTNRHFGKQMQNFSRFVSTDKFTDNFFDLTKLGFN